MLGKGIKISFYFIFLSITVKGQTYFNQTYNNFNLEYFGYGSVLINDSTFVVDGIGYNSDGTRSYTVTSIKTSNGDTSWFKKHGNTIDYYFCGQGKTCLFDGQYIFSCGTYSDTSGKFVPFIMKHNSVGQLIWEKKIMTNVYDSYFSAIQKTNDNKLIFSGLKGISPTNSDYYLVKMDTSGNIVWENNFGSGSLEQCYTVDTLLDGGFILTGYRDLGTGVDGYLVKTDSLGNLQWEKLMGNNTALWGKTLHDGNIVVYGGKKNPTPSDADAYIAIVDDTTNTVINEKSFILSNLDYSIFCDVQERNNSLYFTGGYWSNIISNPVGAWFKTNYNLDSLSFHSYNARTNDNYLNSITALPDGGFIMAGYVFPDTTAGSTEDGWIIRVDSIGCENMSCALSVDEIENKNTKSISAYPNPTQNTITIEFNAAISENYSIQILNVVGQVVQLNKFPVLVGSNKINLDLKNIESGILFIKVFSTNTIIGTTKILKQ